MAGCCGGAEEHAPTDPQLHREMTVPSCTVLLQDQGQHLLDTAPSCFSAATPMLVCDFNILGPLSFHYTCSATLPARIIPTTAFSISRHGLVLLERNDKTNPLDGHTNSCSLVSAPTSSAKMLLVITLYSMPHSGYSKPASP